MNVNINWDCVVVVSDEIKPSTLARLDQLDSNSIHLFTQDFSINDDSTFIENHQNIQIHNEKFIPDVLVTLNNGKFIDSLFVFSDDDAFKLEINQFCLNHRIPLNVHNTPNLSTFTVPASYTNGPLHVSISTSLKGCKMASRIKREIIKSLPPNIDEIIMNVSELRSTLKKNGNSKDQLKWLAQIIDYYPLSKLNNLSIDDLSNTLNLTGSLKENVPLDLIKKGSISLIGSGPGSLSNLTLGAINSIYEADLVLADKLVPQEILNLIPQSTQVFIARKFPGNADLAQQELLDLGLKALKEGKNVVRLKQGDPYIFGRGGEEWIWFNNHGFKVNVLSGLTSPFVACARANVPTTHRGVADQVLICTGVGKAGTIPDNLPSFEPKRTTIFLMSIKRIVDILDVLKSKGWPGELPVSIVERASCGDERVIRTTFDSLIDVCNQIESRPPGLIIMGWACNVYGSLAKNQKFSVIESGSSDDTDLEKIIGYLKKE